MVIPGRQGKAEKTLWALISAGDFLSGSAPLEGQKCQEISLLLSGLQSCHTTLSTVLRPGGGHMCVCPLAQ